MNCVLQTKWRPPLFILQEVFLAINRKIMEVVNSEDNDLRSYIGYNGSYIGYISYNGSYIGYKSYSGNYIGFIGYKE